MSTTTPTATRTRNAKGVATVTITGAWVRINGQPAKVGVPSTLSGKRAECAFATFWIPTAEFQQPKYQGLPVYIGMSSTDSSGRVSKRAHSDIITGTYIAVAVVEA